MTDLQKRCLDIDYIIMRDKVIKNLLDYDKYYTLDDSKKVKKLVKILNDILERYWPYLFFLLYYNWGGVIMIRCNIVDKVSKNGNNYKCLEIYLTDTYKKIVFLDKAEMELLKLSNNDF